MMDKDLDDEKLAGHVHNGTEPVETYAHVSVTHSGKHVIEKKRKPTITFFRLQAFLRKKDKPRELPPEEISH